LHFHNCIISRTWFSFSIIELYWTNLPMVETRGIPAQFGVNYVVWQTFSTPCQLGKLWIPHWRPRRTEGLLDGTCFFRPVGRTVVHSDIQSC
jgi:hypothetical protein